MSGRDTRLDRLNASRDPEFWKHPPPRWKNCPKLGDIIENLFLPFKTPLDSRYDSDLSNDQKFSVEDVFDEADRKGKDVAAWIDLTKATRFYSEQERQSFNAHPDTSYIKIRCEGHEGAPDSQTTRLFIEICAKMFGKPGKRRSCIAVHCTHGFNRTGFLICAYLVEKLDWSVDAAVDAFAKCRPPGIYKEDYLRELFERYDDVSMMTPVPELPEWCYDEENGAATKDDDGVQRGEAGPSGSGSKAANGKKEGPKFMDGVPGVEHVTDRAVVQRVRQKCKQYSHWKRDDFPGCQPVSMDNDNKDLLARQAYDVSWKADGVRYMLFVEDKDLVFFVDRNNDVFQAYDMHFPRAPDTDEWVSETLLDGEMILDKQENGAIRARYLIYDMIHYMDQDIGRQDFRVRCHHIRRRICEPRDVQVMKGVFNKEHEPFSIRWKQFFPILTAEKLLEPGGTFARTLSHEVDGLVFQPIADPYIPGRCDKVMKWKPPEQCTVDFKLVVTQQGGKGMLVTTKGLLYVNGFEPPFGELKWSKSMRQHDKKILECGYDKPTGKWVFQRVREDKSFPNHYTTANSVMKGIMNPLTKPMLLEFIRRRAVHDYKPNERPVPPRQGVIVGKRPDMGGSSSEDPSKRPRVY